MVDEKVFTNVQSYEDNFLNNNIPDKFNTIHSVICVWDFILLLFFVCISIST